MAETNFPVTSRYFAKETAEVVLPDGRRVVYLKRRMVPPPERFELLQEYRVSGADRLDHIAAQFIGDPEQFWRICDANGVLHPEELTEEPGNVVRITLPEGIPGGIDG